MNIIRKDYNTQEFIVKVDSEQSQDDKYVYVEGYATTFGNKDSYGDIMLPSIIDEQIQLKDFNQKSLLGHKSWDIESNVGSIVEFSKNDIGIRYKARVLKTPKNNEHFIPMLEAGEIKSVSIGFEPIEYTKNDSGGYTYSKIRIREVSFVNFPANEKANIDIVKQDNAKQKGVLSMEFETKLEEFKNEVKKTLEEVKNKSEKEKSEAIEGFTKQFGELEKKFFESNMHNKVEGTETERFFKQMEVVKTFTEGKGLALKSQNTISNVDGGYLVTPATFSKDVYDAVYNDTGSLTSVVNSMIVPTKEHIAYIQTQKPIAYFRGELETSKISGAKFHEEKFQQKALTVYTSYTFQFFMWQGVFNESKLKNQMATAIQDAKNYAILNGKGNTSYDGILSNPALPVVTTEANNILSWEDFLKITAEVKGNPSKQTVVMHKKTLAKYLSQKDSTGRPIFNMITDPKTGLSMPAFHGYKLIVVGDYMNEAGVYVPMMDTVGDNGQFATGSAPILIGDFSNYMTVSSARVNLINDPYTNADIELTRLFMHTYTDGRAIDINTFAKIVIKG